MDEDGNLDFFNESFTQNGRAVFPLEALGRYEDARNMRPVDDLLILNRDRAVVPALARLTQQQAAAYFMLGETQGTSAGGNDEAGKALRVPGTNPFFPVPHEVQGNRFLELLAPTRSRLPDEHRSRGRQGPRLQEDHRRPLLRLRHRHRRGRRRLDRGHRLRLPRGERGPRH